ncbi:uncharacterized protein LOC116351807, partial [Contarinia nasturtii]|uniref:uncharacterized protein LOC116351807 n=1 Tax=Contarinia nasturtii TaxID=265458 RepID=UPI0012D3DF65
MAHGYDLRERKPQPKPIDFGCEYYRNDRVLARDPIDKIWYDAKIKECIQDGKMYRVHYRHYGPKFDATLEAKNIRKHPAEQEKNKNKKKGRPQRVAPRPLILPPPTTTPLPPLQPIIVPVLPQPINNAQNLALWNLNQTYIDNVLQNETNPSLFNK